MENHKFEAFGCGNLPWKTFDLHSNLFAKSPQYAQPCWRNGDFFVWGSNSKIVDLSRTLSIASHDVKQLLQIPACFSQCLQNVTLFLKAETILAQNENWATEQKM